jgi:hypothetical protein
VESNKHAFKKKGTDMEAKKSVAEHTIETWHAFTDAQRLELITASEQRADKRLNELWRGNGVIPAGWYRRNWEAKAIPGALGAFVAAIAERGGHV